MAENTVSHHSCEELAVDPKILADGVIESILKWLPYESLVRFRTVCKDWNNLLSAHHFLSWRKENFKENPWLLIVSEGKYCHHLNVSAQVMKVFPVNNKVLASVGGLLLIPGRSRGKLFLYNPFTRRGIRIRQRREYRKEQKIVASNPARETFAQLPLPILSKQNGIRVGDILWKGNQYQVVAVLDNFIEVYNFSKQSWLQCFRGV
ncbi:hypothetical protein SUGI_0539190 [Cryptomeria japonica]|nr:hypothetical protein SUGI_0539190 [Cryptomeria japonica]